MTLVARHVELLRAAEAALADGFDSVAARSSAADDIGPQCWYAADVCRRHAAALGPFVRDAHAWDGESPIGDVGTAADADARLGLKDLFLMTSVVELSWRLVAESAAQDENVALSQLAHRCRPQAREQLIWLLRRIHGDEVPSQAWSSHAR